MINNVVLVGRLTKDCDLRYTPSGAAVARFNLAVNRSFKNENGDYDADFISCVIWRQSAEALANFTRKGSLICVTGRIQTGSYVKDGRTVYTTEVIAENFRLLESRKDNKQSNQQGNLKQNDIPEKSYDPFGQASQIDINDDDLPF